MDSSIPPPPSIRRKLRPWYLVAAMALTWFIGVKGLTTGWTIASFLRSGLTPDVVTATRNAESAGHMAEFAQLWGAVEIESMQAIRRITFPLSIAQVLLSGLLVIASGLAMTGRRGSRTLALQALFANAALAGISYALTRGVRAQCIEAVIRAADALPHDLPQRAELANREAMWWIARIKLGVVDIGTLALGALALTRLRTKTFFEAAARAAESAEEP